MLNLAFIAITVLFPLFAVELKDLQRTEDWEVRLGEAELKYKEAARYWMSATGEESDEHSTTLNNLGEVYRQMGRYPEAEKTYRALLVIREAIVKTDQLRLVGALNNPATSQLQAEGLGALGVARTQRRFAEAEASFQRSLRIKRAITVSGSRRRTCPP